MKFFAENVIITPYCEKGESFVEQKYDEKVIGAAGNVQIYA